MARPNKIWFRKSTGWWVVVIDGEWKKLAKGKGNKAAADTKFHELMLLRAEAPEDASARVAALCEAFLRWSKLHHADDTYRNHAFYIQSFAEACGQLLVKDLKVFHVTRWVDGKTAWKETSAYNARRFVFRVFTWAKEQGMIAKNPLEGLKKGKPNPRMRALSVDEYNLLLKEAKGEFKTFLYALRQTGARPKEVRTVQWKHVKTDRWVFPEHKTDEHTTKPRTVYLTPPMQKLMQKLPKNSPYVFLNKRGKPWTTNAVRLQIARIKKKLGLSADVCAYLVRHGWGTQAILNGTNPAVVAELMGHSSLEMVSKVYVHLADQHAHLQDAMTSATKMPTPSKAARPSGE